MTIVSSMQAMTLAVPPQTPARLNVNLENPLQPLRPSHGRMTLNWRLLLLAIRCFRPVALSPLRRCHQRTVLAVRGEYTVETCQIDSGLGHQGG